ncbi:MAG: cupin domain-containing protein [Devosiaceae bacterium]|nr:cupin domain-containing protein [Devosiaceae bacterium MH13]
MTQAPNPQIYHRDSLPSFNRGGGNATTPLVTRASGTRQMLSGTTTIAPGGAIPLHTHNCEECIVVLDGWGYFDIDGEATRIERHDAGWVPEEVPHRVRNGSDTEPMTILWVYASVDATRTLVETGETRPVSAEHDPSRRTVSNS